MREDELVVFGSVEEFERYENDDIQDKFDEDREIESGSDCCDGGCSNDEGNGDACHEDSNCDVGDGDGSDDSDNGDGVDEVTGGGAPAGAQVCSDSDIEPHPHGNCGRPPHHALSRLDKSRVVSFIRNYAAINALPDPGWLKGMVRDYVLESGKIMKSVYAEYCKIMEFLLKSTPAPQQPCPYQLTSGLKRQYTLLNVPPASPTRLTACAVNYMSFITLWHRYCSNIKIQPARSDLCDKCDQMLVSLQHSLSDEKHKEKNDKYNQHHIKAKAFRDSYNTNIEDAEKEWGRKRQKDRDQILGCLDSRIQLSLFTSHAYLDMQMQYSFDYCQQVSLPYSSQQRGTFYFRTPTPQGPEQIAVVVVSQLHAFFHLHGLGEKRVTLQADNCVGQNKNTTMLWYTCMAWRVITGQHERIQLNFMLPGHTKFQPDSYFGLFKKHYRRQDHLDDMDDLVDCVRQCGQNITCVPQLCKGLAVV
eukprot:Em0019g484a